MFRCPPVLFLLVGPVLSFSSAEAGDALTPTGTRPLTLADDPAETLVDGVDRFLLKQIEHTAQQRHQRWLAATKLSTAERKQFLQKRRQQLREILGMRTSRLAGPPELVTSLTNTDSVSTADGVQIHRIRWPVLGDPAPGRQQLASVFGEGLWLQPSGDVRGTVIAVPDADQSPEQVCGRTDGLPPQGRFALNLARSGYQVFVPALISREVQRRNQRGTMTDREFIYRGSYVLGEHLLGYELQKILSLVDWSRQQNPDQPIGVAGYGEGGLLALLAGAVDERIAATVVSGFFGPREASWQEPLGRNVFGLLQDFGAAELAALSTPGTVIVEAAAPPSFEFSQNGGAPSILLAPPVDEVSAEATRAQALGADIRFFRAEDGPLEDRNWWNSFTEELSPGAAQWPDSTLASPETDSSSFATERRQRQLQELDRHNQAILRESAYVRREFLSDLDTSSVAAFEKSVETWRSRFQHDVIGHFDLPLLPPNAQSRLLKKTDQWTAWEIWLDVFEDVGAYGVLLLPGNLQPGERRPVVVCQHGLEGRPQDTFQDNHRAYHDYAARLCERGFITFAPQNIYILKDRFRTLQRKANPIGRTLFSVIVPQHQQIVNWLKSQPWTDGDRIAFYGLSYGGKSAMRIPALVTDYCLSICSGDFNEWVRKNASTRDNFSYVWYSEYEIFEWNLGRTFNYAEMAALICPRPFMVERGHFDGVGEDEWVGFEYAKVRNLYAAQLKIPDRTEIEWFDGPHAINGQGTFDFLHKHLNWPKH